MTPFKVTIDDQTYMVAVKSDDYQAEAIVMIECIAHYRNLSKHDAIQLYTNSKKTVKHTTLSIDGVSVSEGREQHLYDFIITPPERTLHDFRAYWRQ